jgi:hypothetical protein
LISSIAASREQDHAGLGGQLDALAAHGPPGADDEVALVWAHVAGVKVLDGKVDDLGVGLRGSGIGAILLLFKSCK